MNIWVEFCVDEKYDDLELCGSGAYGMVVSAVDVTRPAEKVLNFCFFFSFK